MISLFWSDLELLLLAVGGVVSGALLIWRLIRWLNCRDAPRHRLPRAP